MPLDDRIPAFFHPSQLAFQPRYEWALGERIDHPESTARAQSILAALQAAGSRFALSAPAPVPDGAIAAQHDDRLLALYRTATEIPLGEAIYPTVFPGRPHAADPTNLHHAGAWCFDAGTPLTRHTWEAAVWSAACAHQAARALITERRPLTYALSRPPGHHATEGSFGGYCYLNNAALAARVLRRRGRVAVLDIDVHHGNGTQSLFWRDARVLTVSIHEHPDRCFPYFAGFPSETGAGRGAGTTLNLTEEAGCDGERYRTLLERHALPAIRAFAPHALVLSAGLDTYHLDPVGHFALTTEDLGEVGELIGRLGLPTVAVQEGGYYTPDLGKNAVALLDGLARGQRHAQRA